MTGAQSRRRDDDEQDILRLRSEQMLLMPVALQEAAALRFDEGLQKREEAANLTDGKACVVEEVQVAG